MWSSRQLLLCGGPSYKLYHYSSRLGDFQHGCWNTTSFLVFLTLVLIHVSWNYMRELIYYVLHVSFLEALLSLMLIVMTLRSYRGDGQSQWS